MQAAVKSWAIRGSAIAILAVSAALGNEVRRNVAVRPLDLKGDMARLGAWRCVEVGKIESIEEGSAFKQAAEYQNDQGVRIQAYFVTTATRVGALRDYSVGLEAEGWVLHKTETVIGPTIAHLGQPMSATLESFSQSGKELLAINWFVSGRRQAQNLRQADFAGWADLLTQVRPPLWAELYATIPVEKSAAEARRALMDFATQAAPKLSAIVTNERDAKSSSYVTRAR